MFRAAKPGKRDVSADCAAELRVAATVAPAASDVFRKSRLSYSTSALRASSREPGRRSPRAVRHRRFRNAGEVRRLVCAAGALVARDQRIEAERAGAIDLAVG